MLRRRGEAGGAGVRGGHKRRAGRYSGEIRARWHLQRRGEEDGGGGGGGEGLDRAQQRLHHLRSRSREMRRGEEAAGAGEVCRGARACSRYRMSPPTMSSNGAPSAASASEAAYKWQVGAPRPCRCALFGRLKKRWRGHREPPRRSGVRRSGRSRVGATKRAHGAPYSRRAEAMFNERRRVVPPQSNGGDGGGGGHGRGVGADVLGAQRHDRGQVTEEHSAEGSAGGRRQAYRETAGNPRLGRSSRALRRPSRASQPLRLRSRVRRGGLRLGSHREGQWSAVP